MKINLLILFLAVVFVRNAAAQNNDRYFKFNLQPGQKTGTVFMRTISVASDSFPEVVNRVSGTGDYTVTQANSDSASFAVIFRVDGHPASKFNVGITDEGRSIVFSGKKSANHEGSGLAFNAFLWGQPPAKLKKGDTWTVHIDHQWEGGGPGLQKVTVVYADPANHTICLRRDGESEGFYEGEPKEITITKNGQPVKMKLNPGTTHWTGYTIFREGLVISDELIATRPLTLSAGDTVYKAEQREYMMLNSKAD